MASNPGRMPKTRVRMPRKQGQMRRASQMRARVPRAVPRGQTRTQVMRSRQTRRTRCPFSRPLPRKIPRKARSTPPLFPFVASAAHDSAKKSSRTDSIAPARRKLFGIQRFRRLCRSHGMFHAKHRGKLSRVFHMKHRGMRSWVFHMKHPAVCGSAYPTALRERLPGGLSRAKTCDDGNGRYSTPTITSVDLIMARAFPPSARPSCSIASLVMEPVILLPSASSRTT